MAEQYAFDMGALMATMEASLLKNMMATLSRETVPPEQQRIFNGIIDTFTRHGIRATEGLAILMEITEVIQRESEGA